MQADTINDAATMYRDTVNDVATNAFDGGQMLAGRFRIVKPLGQGGMGSVWLVEDTLLDGKRFAVKMLPSVLASNKRAYRQLKDEALVAMKLTHPNIVTIRAFEENEGNPFLVMDYVEGQPLDGYIAEHAAGRGGLPESEVLRILKPVASALDYAHEQGVVHRDIKPGNVMIRSDGHPFILDFGIAREIQETMTRVTGKLSSGTLLYMSPEQLHGAAPKPQQDIYSFGAMAYECLKGEPPFTRGQIEFQIDNDPPESLVESDGISAPLAEGVMSALAKNPDERPATCMEVLEGNVSRRAAKAHSSHSSFGKTIGILALLAALAVGGWYVFHKNNFPKHGDVKTLTLADGVTMDMIYVAPGSFQMGSPSSEDGYELDEAQHRVTLTKGFWLGKYEVTQKQWRSVMGSNPSNWKGDNLPVETVSWDDCQEFIRKVDAEARRQLGGGARLPTEAEWEYACRAGTTTAYHWGNALRGDKANCNGNYPCGTAQKGPYLKKTTPVGQYGANPWGFCDMHGNVCEWCSDCYVEDYYANSPTSDPQGPASGDFRVYRGGCWCSYARHSRSANRSRIAHGSRSGNCGFRLCCSAGR